MRKAEIGTVSCDTHREEHFIPKFLAVLDYYEHPEASLMRTVWNSFFYKSDCIGYEYFVNEKIWDVMQELAPEGCYFGAHPGDGADFGYWSLGY